MTKCIVIMYNDINIKSLIVADEEGRRRDAGLWLYKWGSEKRGLRGRWP